MATSRKKVIVRLLNGGLETGYLPASGLLDGQGAVALLDLEGRVKPVALRAIAYVAYVRDFNLGEAEPERLTRRTFLARPRTDGVWVRLVMLDGALLEGLAAADEGLADGLLEDGGLYLTPPDVRSNTQRLFVPRSAFGAMQVLGVIAPGGVKAKPVTAAPRKTQGSLFP